MYSKARRSADVLVAAAVVLVALAPASGVASIEAAELSGTVTDATGLALTGVVVEARPAGAVAPVQTALTDRTGMFTLSALEPGPCDVTFTLPGFNEVVRAGVEIRPGGATTLDVEMKVGIEEQVVVIGSRAQMRTLVPSFNIATHPINDAATLVRPASLRPPDMPRKRNVRLGRLHGRSFGAPRSRKCEAGGWVRLDVEAQVELRAGEASWRFV